MNETQDSEARSAPEETEIAGERSGWVWLPVSGLVIALDQLTKFLVSTRLALYERVEILPVLDFTHMHNPGAAFSFLAGASGWQRWFFSALAVIVGLALLVWLTRLKARTHAILACALALILGGAVGNLIDRLRLGYVVDFIYAHWNERAFPAFNVADSAITVGAGLLLLDAWLDSRRHRKERA